VRRSRLDAQVLPVQAVLPARVGYDGGENLRRGRDAGPRFRALRAEVGPEFTADTPPPFQLRQELGTSTEAPMAVHKFSIFNGYPPELIAQWCGVTVDTAKLYKSGARKASRAVLRLFVLHRDGRVLGEGWQGWQARAGTIADPDGNVTSARQLMNYFFVMQFAAALAAQDPRTVREWHDLLRRA
jgi:hypothetical protein